jgi:superfamily II DNA or RNA helicase
MPAREGRTVTALGIPGVQAPAHTPIALRPYQQDIVTAIHEGLRSGGTGQIRMACGSGKTIVGQRAAEQLLPAGGTVAVLVPSLALIAQTLAAWVQHTEQHLDVLAVCADETVADAVVHVKDLPVPVTTSPQDIAAWLRRPTPGMRLVLCTHLSAPRLADAVIATGALDLAILDEAHHFAGRIDQATRRILRPERLPAARRLFMTATPREDLRPHRTDTDDGAGPVVGMEDETVFGPVLGDYPFARGIAEGYLKDYRIAVIGVRDRDARALMTEPGVEYVDTPGGPSLQTVVAQAALGRARQQFGIRRALTFHPRVEAAAEFSRTLAATLAQAAAGEQHDLYAAHVHGEMEQRLRQRIVGRLRDVPGSWSVISNARCLGEGVDIPAVDAVLFAHPKKSAVDISQAVGRALRRHPHTPGPATIIVPLVVPEEDGEIGDLEPGDYATLWQVVRALRAHDEALGGALDARRGDYGNSDPVLPGKITVMLPPGTSRTFLTDLKLMLVRQTTSIWWEGYDRAARFYAEHGHLRIPRSHPDGTGAWLSHQRHQRSTGRLPAERVTLLDEIGMEWSIDIAAERRAEGLAQARRFHAETGSLDVPQTYVTADGYGLGAYLVYQRAAFAAGKLPPDHVAALNQLGMIWSRSDRWRGYFRKAKAFFDREGHLSAPAGHREDGLHLCVWLTSQRRRYRNGAMPREEIELLEAIGMDWAPKDGPPKRVRKTWPDGARERLLNLLRAGATMRVACETAGVTTKQVAAYARAHPDWSGALDAATMAGRDPSLEHGTHRTYRYHECRCPECRSCHAASKTG